MDVSASTWSALSKLLDEMLDLDAAERADWLERLAASRPELAPELRKLLAAHATSETADLLKRLPTIAGGEESVDAQPPRSAPQRGDHVGPYRLLRELGRGGMADVWLVERADGELKRKAALKLPRLTWGDALVQRMARERDILAALTHPNIARLYDAGADALGRPWLALEYVQGRPIDVAAREQELDVPARLKLLLQVCDAVAYAHSLLVIHRDLKPSNILVTDDGQIRLLDFGIAKLLQGERTEATALTRHAGLAMTPDYASPEQVRGDPLGTASDVYSLGVVAYELLTGQRPYRLRRGTVAELEEAIAGADVRRASDVAPPALRKRLRGDLDAILNRALKKEPAERYPTVVALSDDIARHLQGFAVSARPESRWYLARKFVRRHRLPVAAAAAVVLALGIGLGAALWQTRVARENLVRAERTLERESAARDLYFEAFSTMAAWDAASFAEPRSVVRLLLRKLEELELRYKDQPEQRLALLTLVATQLPYLGDYEGSLVVGRRYLELLWQSQPHPSHLMDGYKQHARMQQNLGRLADAEATLREGIAKIPRQDEAPVARARMYSQFGYVLQAQGKRIEARAVTSRAIGWLEGREPKDDTLSELLRVLMRVHRGHDDPEALRIIQRSHQAMLRQSNAQAAPLGVSYQALAVGLVSVGRSAEAEAALREAVSRFETLYGVVDRDTVFAVCRLAHAIAAQGRYTEARQLLAERRLLVEQRPGSDTTNALQTLAGWQLEVELLHGDIHAAAPLVSASDAKADPTLADKAVQPVADARYLRWAGDHAEAISRTARWLEALSPALRNSADAHRVRVALAESRWAAGHHDAASAEWLQLLTAMRETGSTKNWSYLQATEWAAVALAATGKLADAMAMLQSLEPLHAEDRVLPVSRAERADSAWRRASVLLAAGQRGQAAALAQAMQADLEGQHPDSPRRVASQRLAAALSP